MKKLTSILMAMTLSAFSVNSENISVGISGNAGMLDATAKETRTNGNTTQETDDLAIAYVSGFAELHLPMDFGPGNLRVGLSYVPYALESETNSSFRAEGERANAGTGNNGGSETAYTPKAAFTQKVQVDIEDLMTYYLSYHVNNFYVKAGVIEADLITNETLESGSVYANASLEGTFYGIGFDKNLSDGIFVRGELGQTEYDSIKLTSTGSDNANVIDVTNLSGTNFAISVGKSF
ncbi:hypothetical protein N8934_00200 [Candidatus Pelagibacter sp.]|nr:hypothetical protein [Candidatus Pelagibacter sp.]